MPATSTFLPAATVARRARLDELAMLALADASGLELGAYRSDHVEECLRRAVEREGAAGAHELARLLRFDARARERFRRSVAGSVTGMFRDPGQFEAIAPLLAR